MQQQKSGEARAIRIAVLAMGGEGGGVLANWLVDLARRNAYVAQMTSVPGVAQRTGATMYYIEIFPTAQIGIGQQPVLALMPVPGDVDIVLASELMEAGRAIQRGIVTPDRTALIASSHRVFSMTERVAMADGRVDEQALLGACRSAAHRFVAFDMMKMAEQSGSVISAVLFGALAGAGLLPFERGVFEETIKQGGVGVRASLLAFAAGYEAAKSGKVPSRVDEKTDVAEPVSFDASLQQQAHMDFSADAHILIDAGIAQCADWQDQAYARSYLAALQPFLDLEKSRSGEASLLLQEVARQLALALCYEDTIRVADLKIRASRFERVAREVGLKNNQILEIREFLHPRRQEILEVLPQFLSRLLGRSAWIARLIDRMTDQGRIVETTSLHGFLLLYCVAQLRRWRRSSPRFVHEQKQIRHWLDLVLKIAQQDYEFAVAVAELRGLVKGYGDTHASSLGKYNKIMAVLAALPAQNATEILKALQKAAQIDDGGKALDARLDELSAADQA